MAIEVLKWYVSRGNAITNGSVHKFIQIYGSNPSVVKKILNYICGNLKIIYYIRTTFLNHIS